VNAPIIALNRAIAVAELDGPEVALAAVDRLEHRLAGYHAYHATRADLLRRQGRSQQSRAAYDKAHNTGAVPLVFVEVRRGDYFGEDDIIWLDDDYGRREPLPAPAV
jgi:predicted RNA polymerase sigma factor